MAERWKCDDDILCGVNVPKDEANPTELEKKHLPVIDAPETVKKDEPFEVKITVGKGIDHPNEAGHFIEWIELYSGDTFLGRAQYSGGSSYPVALFRVQLSHSHGKLKAWDKCNLHGMWESVRDISVE